jgi:transient receptor potential cation channel subfamily A protein 1
MVNQPDMNGYTPIHMAIKGGHLDVCKMLIENNADIKATLRDKRTAAHLCVQHSQPDILSLLLTHGLDANQGDIVGASPLIHCAFMDNVDCAVVLLKFNGDMTKPCNNRLFPIHLAIKNFSNRLTQYLLENCYRYGVEKKTLATLADGDKYKPIHTAVQYDNLEAVKLCLENGSSIDDLSESDRSTAVHIACAQGSLNILKLMLKLQPHHKDKVTIMRDVQFMTPLHRAVMFDHVEVVEYLIELGADIDSLDKENRTPLLLAASRNCLRVVAFLINKNADIQIKDSKRRNMLHLIVNNQRSALKHLSDLNVAKKIRKANGTMNATMDDPAFSLNELSKELVKVKLIQLNNCFRLGLASIRPFFRWLFSLLVLLRTGLS